MPARVGPVDLPASVSLDARSLLQTLYHDSNNIQTRKYSQVSGDSVEGRPTCTRLSIKRLLALLATLGFDTLPQDQQVISA
jgi:hypothetical protein